jgi:hypothetical protein
MGKKGKKSNKNKSTQPEPEPESEVETKIEESIQDDKIEVEQKAINTNDSKKIVEEEQKNDNEEEEKVENTNNAKKEKEEVEKNVKEEVSSGAVIEPKTEEKQVSLEQENENEANNDNITEEIKEEKVNVQEQEKNDEKAENITTELVSEEKEITSDNTVHDVKEEEKGESEEQENKIEADELKERKQEHLETGTPVPNPQDLSLLISDMAMADPFSLPIENDQIIEENRADSAEEFNNTSSISKEIDLSSLPVTPTDINFNESDIERSNLSNNENEETGLEDPFSPQVESPPFEYKEEQVVDNIDESQGYFTSYNGPYQLITIIILVI